LPPKTGECATWATSIPGTFTSMPKMPVPFTLYGLSSRLVGLPISLNVLGSFNVGLAGGVMVAAFSASWPYVRRRLLAAWVTTLLAAVQVEGSTPQVCAAALTSIARAAAPTFRRLA